MQKIRKIQKSVKIQKIQKIRKNKGFTLIELIVVIVILGILAAVAIPRFINQTTGARLAALNGLVGALNSAAALAQANYRAEGKTSTSTSTTTSMDGTSVTVIAGSGYPDATSAGTGIATAARITGFTPTYASGVATFDFSSGAIANCNVTYTASSGTAIVAANSGC